MSAADIAPLVKKEVSVWIKAARTNPRGQTAAHGPIAVTTPYECPFKAFCHADAPEYPIERLPRIGAQAADLRAQGYEDIRDIPAGVLANKVHEWVRKLTVSGKAELRPRSRCHAFGTCLAALLPRLPKL